MTIYSRWTALLAAGALVFSIGCNENNSSPDEGGSSPGGEDGPDGDDASVTEQWTVELSNGRTGSESGTAARANHVDSINRMTIMLSEDTDAVIENDAAYRITVPSVAFGTTGEVPNALGTTDTGSCGTSGEAGASLTLTRFDEEYVVGTFSGQFQCSGDGASDFEATIAFTAKTN